MPEKTDNYVVLGAEGLQIKRWLALIMIFFTYAPGCRPYIDALPGDEATGSSNVPVISPSDISGLKLWFKSDSISGVNSGDSISTWLDQSGGGTSAIQNTTSKKPIYRTDIIHGYPVVYFDGVDDSMLIALDASSWTGISMIGVYRRTSETLTFNAISNYQLGSHGAFLSSKGIHGRPDATAYRISEVAGVDLNFHTIAGTIGDGVLTGFSDGASATPVTGLGAYRGCPGFALGAAGYNDEAFGVGEIAEVLVYDSALSTADRQKVENYLSRKYGL